METEECWSPTSGGAGGWQRQAPGSDANLEGNYTKRYQAIGITHLLFFCIYTLQSLLSLFSLTEKLNFYVTIGKGIFLLFFENPCSIDSF